MDFHRLNTILVRDGHRTAEEKWVTLNDLELLLAQIPWHDFKRQYAVRKQIRTYRKLLTK